MSKRPLDPVEDDTTRRVRARTEPSKDLLTRLIEDAVPLFDAEIKPRLQPLAQVALSLVSRGLRAAVALGSHRFSPLRLWAGGADWNLLIDLAPVDNAVTRVNKERFLVRAIRDGASTLQLRTLARQLQSFGASWTRVRPLSFIGVWPDDVPEQRLIDIVTAIGGWDYDCINAAYNMGWMTLAAELVRRADKRLIRDIGERVVCLLLDTPQLVHDEAVLVHCLKHIPKPYIKLGTSLFELMFVRPSWLLDVLPWRRLLVMPVSWYEVEYLPASNTYERFLCDLSPAQRIHLVERPGFALSLFLWDDLLDRSPIWCWHARQLTLQQEDEYRRELLRRAGQREFDWRYYEERVRALERTLKTI